MDFPVCPECHQSVIDDDAVDCPFCGAPMKGGSSKKPANPAAKPAAPSSKTPAPAAKPSTPVKKPGEKSVPSKPTLPGDDFPFDVELTAGKSAIPAMPNLSKQRTLKVVCPMCDTAGYLPPNAAGKEVRCANPKCVMPIFTAPSDKKDEPAKAKAPEKKASRLPLIAGLTVLLMGAVVGGLYVVNLNPFGGGKPKTKEMSEADKLAMREAAGLNGPGGKKAQPGPNAAVDNKQPAEAEAADAEKAKQELITLILKQMKASCLEGGKVQRHKPYCRQLAAEANAIVGDVDEARSHLALLIKVGSTVTYYRITPLLELFWVDLKAGRDKDAAKSLNTAVGEVPKIPSGRTRYDMVGRTVVALVVAGHDAEAIKILKDIQAGDHPVELDSDAQIAARIQLATDGTVVPLSNTHSVLPWSYPQAVAATGSLISRNYLDLASNWAVQQTSEDARAECVALWAEEFSFLKGEKGKADVGDAIAAAVKTLPAPLAARVWARAGMGRLRAKDREGMQAAAKLAQEKLDEVPKPTLPAMPEMAVTHLFKLPASEPLVQAAIAAAEIANLLGQTNETTPDAEKSVDTAMMFADAIAPSFTIAKQRKDDADRLGNKLRFELKQARKLKNDDEARLAASAYDKMMERIYAAAQQRFDLQVHLLSRLRALNPGLNHKIWKVVNARSSAENIEQRDNFFATDLPRNLAEGLKGTDEEKALRAAAQGFKNTNLTRPVAAEFRDRLQTDVPQAVGFLKTAKLKPHEMEEILLQTSSDLGSTDKFQKALEMIDEISNELGTVREECYRIASALATKSGHAQKVWEHVAEVKQATEKVAICRGIIAGMFNE